jgi:hypothetical protein
MKIGRVLGLAFAMVGPALGLAAQASDQLIIVGAGNSGSWQTEFEFANSLDVPIHAGVGILRKAADPCVTGFCPVKGFDMVAGGSIRENSGGPPAVWDGVATYFVATDGAALPTARAWLVNSAVPLQTIELPAVRLSTITDLQSSVLAFPSAERTDSSHSNLVIAEVGNLGELSIVVEALSADGEVLGSREFTVPSLGTLFLVDVLQTLDVSELASGQIRVSKTGGSGLMWGLLPTLHDEGLITASEGANP